MADGGLLAVGGVGVLAVLALVVSLLRDGGDRVINIPASWGSDSVDAGNPVDEGTPGAGGWVSIPSDDGIWAGGPIDEGNPGDDGVTGMPDPPTQPWRS